MVRHVRHVAIVFYIGDGNLGIMQVEYLALRTGMRSSS